MTPNKAEILQLLGDEFDQWDKRLARLSEAQWLEPHPPDNLSVKDVVAHLWAWQQRSIARVEAALHNREPEFPRWPESLEPEAEDVDPINAWILETNRAKPASAVYGDWRAGFLRLIELTQAIPESDLLQPGRYPWLGEDPLSLVLVSSCEHHHLEHLEPLLAWFSSLGT
jgi:hypothetical protein